MFRKTKTSYPLKHKRTYAYQEVRNVSFSGNFAYILIDVPLTKVRQRGVLAIFVMLFKNSNLLV